MTQYKDFDLDIVKVADSANEEGAQPRITSVSLCTFGCITGTLMCITNTCGCSTSK
jgi:gallidermin/nisin family lantibiotic